MALSSSEVATAPIALVVAWRNGTTTHARYVKSGDPLDGELRSAAEHALAVGALATSQYHPDGIDDGEPRIAGRRDVDDTGLLSAIEAGQNLHPASNAELMGHQLLCYACVFTGADGPTIFVRKSSPVRLGKKTLWTRLNDDTLAKLESPLFSFDGYFDVIVAADTITVLNPKNFELLFKDSEVVLAMIPKWVGELGTTVSMTAGSAEVVSEALATNSYLRRKFRSVIAQPYIGDLPPARIREALAEHGLDPAQFMAGDQLNFTEGNVKDLVQFLNEDLFEGDFSGEQYRAGSKEKFRE